MSEPMWCDGCRSTGAIHCAHPDQCGNMLSATASADQWKAWLDDLPLPFTFDPAIGRLQDFITALTTLIDVPQPASPAEAERDTLAAELAAAKQREARLRAALEYYADTFCEGFCKDLPQAGTYQPEMDLDCSGCKARAALAPTPTDPGDGWTWNERLGWIGPDGKPADPRRRW